VQVEVGKSKTGPSRQFRERGESRRTVLAGCKCAKSQHGWGQSFVALFGVGQSCLNIVSMFGDVVVVVVHGLEN
jgi:hypothetical protein